MDGEVNSDSAKLFGAGNAELAAPRAVAISFHLFVVVVIVVVCKIGRIEM